MQITDTNLSNNPAELKNIIRVLTEQLQEKESVYQQKLNQTENELTRYQAESQRQQSRINQLEHQLRLALQFRFGKSSEKTLSPQLELFDEPRLTVEEEKNSCLRQIMRLRLRVSHARRRAVAANHCRKICHGNKSFMIC